MHRKVAVAPLSRKASGPYWRSGVSDVGGWDASCAGRAGAKGGVSRNVPVRISGMSAFRRSLTPP